MTPTQQALALALEALQSIVEQHDGYCEHHIGATTLSFALANTASDALAPKFADKTITAREVARQVFALCEWFEDLPDGEQDSQEEARFKAGQRFSAKRIRNGIGTWLTDEENARKQLAGAAPAAVAEPAGDAPAWIRIHADGSYSDELLLGRRVEIVRRNSGAWVPLYPREKAATPPPTEPSAEVVLPEPDVCSYTVDSVMRRYELHTHSNRQLRAYGDARAAAAILADRAARGVKQC